MTHLQRQKMIALHESRLRRVLTILDENYYELETNEEAYRYWI